MRTRHPEDWEDTIQTIYMLMNLVKSIFPIKEFILNIGRYFCADYFCGRCKPHTRIGST
jgi:hypothetical protein